MKPDPLSPMSPTVSLKDSEPKLRPKLSITPKDIVRDSTGSDVFVTPVETPSESPLSKASVASASQSKSNVNNKKETSPQNKAPRKLPDLPKLSIPPRKAAEVKDVKP